MNSEKKKKRNKTIDFENSICRDFSVQCIGTKLIKEYEYFYRIRLDKKEKEKKRNEIFLYEKVKSTAVFHSELGDLKSP